MLTWGGVKGLRETPAIDSDLHCHAQSSGYRTVVIACRHALSCTGPRARQMPRLAACGAGRAVQLESDPSQTPCARAGRALQPAAP